MVPIALVYQVSEMWETPTHRDNMAASSNWLGNRDFTPATWVRTPLSSP